jgi:uncharacterized membrane protein YoaK (UPF0700 family)
MADMSRRNFLIVRLVTRSKNDGWNMLAIHKPETIFSLRHAPSWVLLASAAGSVNATAFLACERFVTHVTGTATHIGLYRNSWLIIADYALVLLAFVAGAMASVLAIDGRYHRGKRPLYALPLIVVATILVGVAVSGGLGAFGPFGGVQEQPDFLLLSLLSFAMGLQNAAVATCTGAVVRTTHLTGPATDLGVHLANTLYTSGETRRNAIRGATLRAAKILSFVGGASATVPIAANAGYLSFLVPAVLVLGATALSFVNAWMPRPVAVPVPVPVRATR